MKRKILSLILALTLCLGLTVPAFAVETYTETYDGIAITATSDGTLSFSGTGELWIDHLYNSLVDLSVVYMDVPGTVSVNIAPGITYGDSITAYGGIQEAFEEMALALGLDWTINTDSTPSTPAQPSDPAPAASLTVNPNSSTVLVNGKSVSFDAYTINDNNYFKLRDLASVLSGTEKQFEVSWDGAANAISLTSGQSYTAVGGEMAAGVSGAQTAKPTSSKILLDGREVSLTAYNINNNNYFKLRDIGEVFDFGIGWDNASKTITIDTSTGYTA